MRLNTLAIATALTSALFAANTMAAGDGSLGATSTGQSDVTLTIANQAQITGVDNIGLGTFDGSTDLVGQTAFCVYRSGGDNYNMTVSITGKTTFEVESATTSDTIGFTAQIDGDNDASNGSAILEGGTSANYTGSGALDCGSADNASLEVTFAAADLRAASSAADYTATMQILVTPI